MNYAAVSMSVLFMGILGWMYFLNHRATRRGRSGLLDQCAALLDHPEISRNEAGYANLEGRYQGFAVRMMLEEDHLGVRKIPSLWLHLVVKGKASVAGTLDMLMRPQNTEFYSPSWDWHGQVTPLPGWPWHAIYRTRDEAPDLQKIDASVRRLFDDEKAKELLLMPQSIRLTYQAKQADRGEYLLLRAAAFDHDPLSQDAVRELLDQAVGIRQSLEGNQNEYRH